jgi:biotin transport system substrate-specific component
MQSNQTTLIAAAWPATERFAAVRAILLVIAGSLLLTIAAKTQVPMWPVQMSMQSFAVLLIGTTYGWRLGGATVLAYLAQGFAGLPVFGGAVAGPAYFLGPTAGFLIGFVLTAVIAGWLAERGWARSFPKLVAALVLANAAMYVPGLAWLWIGYMPGLGETLAAGMVPFLIGDAVKLLLVAAVLHAGWTVLGRRKA